jgi:uncharacterized protein
MRVSSEAETAGRGQNQVEERLARHGHVSYLEIPTINAEESANFYEAVFGWSIHRKNDGGRSFGDGSGDLIGRWVEGRPASREAGLVPYIYVNEIDDVLAHIKTKGGEIVKPLYPEGNLWVATFRDPSGNLLGIWQAGARR